MLSTLLRRLSLSSALSSVPTLLRSARLRLERASQDRDIPSRDETRRSSRWNAERRDVSIRRYSRANSMQLERGGQPGQTSSVERARGERLRELLAGRRAQPVRPPSRFGSRFAKLQLRGALRRVYFDHSLLPRASSKSRDALTVSKCPASDSDKIGRFELGRHIASNFPR